MDVNSIHMPQPTHRTIPYRKHPTAIQSRPRKVPVSAMTGGMGRSMDIATHQENVNIQRHHRAQVGGVPPKTVSSQAIARQRQVEARQRREMEARSTQAVLGYDQPSYEQADEYEEVIQPIKRTSIWKTALIVIASFGAVSLLAFGGWNLYSQKSSAVVAPFDSSKYQAVFLAGGQVYFGKIDYINDNYLRLKNVFYIQSDTTSQSDTDNKTKSKTTGSDNSAEAGSMKLIKLGDEIHGPEDSMTVNRSQVLFFEDLKPDGKVAKLISQYQPGN